MDTIEEVVEEQYKKSKVRNISESEYKFFSRLQSFSENQFDLDSPSATVFGYQQSENGILQISFDNRLQNSIYIQSKKNQLFKKYSDSKIKVKNQVKKVFLNFLSNKKKREVLLEKMQNQETQDSLINDATDNPNYENQKEIELQKIKVIQQELNSTNKCKRNFTMQERQSLKTKEFQVLKKMRKNQIGQKLQLARSQLIEFKVKINQIWFKKLKEVNQ